MYLSRSISFSEIGLLRGSTSRSVQHLGLCRRYRTRSVQEQTDYGECGSSQREYITTHKFHLSLLHPQRYSLTFLLSKIAFVARLSQHMTALRNPEMFLNFSFRRAAMLATCGKV
jgi:hypothetical protein